MCLYPRIMKNQKYVKNKKNGGVIPHMRDYRVKYVTIGCGNCIECRHKKAREWQVRLMEEIRSGANGYFVTLTFDEDKLNALINDANSDNSNEVATLAVRRFNERWRRKHKRSIKHWLITELGHEGTERVHLHGILFTDKANKEDIEKIWSYGWVYIGEYCNEKTVNYIIKYVNKIDTDHKGYVQKILCSPGIGKTYIDTPAARRNTYKGINTRDFYLLPNGGKIQLPIYYRNKIYSEDERELLWCQMLDKQETYVMGIKLPMKTTVDYNKYIRILKTQQEENKKLGYGDLTDEWKEKVYKARLMRLNGAN